MAKGTSKISTWDHWVSVLRTKQCRFRMMRQPNKSFIFVREFEGGVKIAQFSSKIYRCDSDADIAACAAQCIAASQGKGWGST